ncbi:MAG TPA: hypothetical protein VIH48_04655 [Candidatus Bathyarchaeia archaeon]
MSCEKPRGQAQPHIALPKVAPIIKNMAIEARGNAGETIHANDRFLCNIPKLHRTVLLGMAKHSRTGKNTGRSGNPKNAALNIMKKPN